MVINTTLVMILSPKTDILCQRLVYEAKDYFLKPKTGFSVAKSWFIKQKLKFETKVWWLIWHWLWLWGQRLIIKVKDWFMRTKTTVWSQTLYFLGPKAELLSKGLTSEAKLWYLIRQWSWFLRPNTDILGQTLIYHAKDSFLEPIWDFSEPKIVELIEIEFLGPKTKTD